MREVPLYAVAGSRNFWPLRVRAPSFPSAPLLTRIRASDAAIPSSLPWRACVIEYSAVRAEACASLSAPLSLSITRSFVLSLSLSLSLARSLALGWVPYLCWRKLDRAEHGLWSYGGGTSIQHRHVDLLWREFCGGDGGDRTLQDASLPRTSAQGYLAHKKAPYPLGLA